jgi:hypothetical protein
MGESLGDERRLSLAEIRQRRVLAALKASLGDERRFAVANQDKGRDQVPRQLERL